MVTSVSSMSSSLTTLQSLLKSADTNANGVVSAEELSTTLTANGDAAAELVSAADSDGDGTMSLSEFSTFAEKFSTETGLALLSAQEAASSLTSAFTDWDADGSGAVTATEITTAVSEATAAAETTSESSETDEETSDEDSDIAYTDATGTTYTEDEINDIIATVDENGDGVYDKSDVTSALLDAMEDASSDDDDIDSDSVLSALHGMEEDEETSTTSDETSTG